MPYNEFGDWEDEGYEYQGYLSGAEGPGAGYGPDDSYGSPYEKAEAEGYLDAFNAQNEAIYASPEATQAAVDEGVNLYDEPEGGGGGGGDRQYTAEEEEFLRNNPGDYDRMAAALANDTDPTDEPGEPGWTGDGGGRTSQRSAASTYESQLASMGARYGGPGRPHPAYKGPPVQVGQDPFSRLITGGYADLIAGRGQTPFGKEMEDYLRRLMARGGEIEEDPRLLAQQMEAARQPIESFRKMQTNQYKGQLADRGLLSEPGMPQGTEISAAGRLEEELAPWYASAGQNLASERAREKGQRFDRAVTLGTGLAGQQSQDFLNALRGGHERQTGLSEIALGTLDRNMAWNRFLAEFGMDRDQALETLQSGRVDDVNQMLELFQDFVDASRGGYR